MGTAGSGVPPEWCGAPTPRPRDRPSVEMPGAVRRGSNYDLCEGAGATGRSSKEGRLSAMRGQSRSMSDVQPSGTVTLVFTDVEGSTDLLEELGTDAYRDALGEHRRVVRDAFALYHGYEVTGLRGDAFVLLRAGGGVGGERGDGRARGGTDPHPRRYPHQAARSRPAVGTSAWTFTEPRGSWVRTAVAGASSPSTVALLEPNSFELQDLGEHRFKDLGAAERVFQLGKGEFTRPQPQRTNSACAADALPRGGGVGDGGDARRVPRAPRVVGGTGRDGKTWRLALQAAAEASDVHPDGVFRAPLAPLRDSALVLPAVAAALSVGERNDSSPINDLALALAGRKMLVFVDNVEHLAGGC